MFVCVKAVDVLVGYHDEVLVICVPHHDTVFARVRRCSCFSFCCLRTRTERRCAGAVFVGEVGGGGVGGGVGERVRVGEMSRVMRVTVEFDDERSDSVCDWRSGRDDVEVCDEGGVGDVMTGVDAVCLGMLFAGEKVLVEIEEMSEARCSVLWLDVSPSTFCVSLFVMYKISSCLLVFLVWKIE